MLSIFPSKQTTGSREPRFSSFQPSEEGRGDDIIWNLQRRGGKREEEEQVRRGGGREGGKEADSGPVRLLPSVSLSPSAVSARVEKSFSKLWCGLTRSSCPPLLGPVRHLAGHRWQRYDGLGIVIQDACHLFTSRPSLISHHGPYNLQADTPQTQSLPHPPSPLDAARHAIQDNTIHYNSFFFFSSSFFLFLLPP